MDQATEDSDHIFYKLSLLPRLEKFTNRRTRAEMRLFLSRLDMMFVLVGIVSDIRKICIFGLHLDGWPRDWFLDVYQGEDDLWERATYAEVVEAFKKKWSTMGEYEEVRREVARREKAKRRQGKHHTRPAPISAPNTCD